MCLHVGGVCLCVLYNIVHKCVLLGIQQNFYNKDTIGNTVVLFMKVPLFRGFYMYTYINVMSNGAEQW